MMSGSFSFSGMKTADKTMYYLAYRHRVTLSCIECPSVAILVLSLIILCWLPFKTIKEDHDLANYTIYLIQRVLKCGLNVLSCSLQRVFSWAL